MKIILLIFFKLNFYLVSCRSGEGSGSGDGVDRTTTIITEGMSAETQATNLPDNTTYPPSSTSIMTTLDPHIQKCKHLNKIRGENNNY